MKKIQKGEKVCWLSKEYNNGWSLGLSIGKKTFWLSGARFKDAQSIKNVLSNSIVFIHLADSKEKNS